MVWSGAAAGWLADMPPAPPPSSPPCTRPHAQRRAGAKGFGLFTKQDLQAGQFIIE